MRQEGESGRTKYARFLLQNYMTHDIYHMNIMIDALPGCIFTVSFGIELIAGAKNREHYRGAVLVPKHTVSLVDG